MDQLTELKGLADIVEPQPPEWWPLIMAVLAITTIIAAVISIWKIKQKRAHANMPLKKLQRLETQWKSGELDDRTTAYWLASLLRRHLQLSNLPDDAPAGLPANRQEWRHTIEQLKTVRYQNHKNQHLSSDTFHTIRQWLQHNGNIT